MSKADQYKTLYKNEQGVNRTWKNDFNDLHDKFNNSLDEIVLLKTEIKRLRSRKWYQFWKFLKRNQII